MENLITKRFIEELRQLYEKGIKLNPDDEVEKRGLKRSLIIERKESEYVFFDDPIMDLIKNYIIDKFDIGAIHFHLYENLVLTEEYIVIGSDGAGDLIAINKISNKICCVDGYYEWILDCSKSSQEFLNNLIKIGNALIDDLPNAEKYKVAEQMSDSTSIEFYLEILGVE